MYYYLTPANKGLPPDWFLGTVVLRDAVVVLLCVLVVRSVLRPDTDPVRAVAPGKWSGSPDIDPDWPATATTPTQDEPDAAVGNRQNGTTG
jgi:hypothetical protein